MSSISFIESKLIRAHSASSLISPESHILSKHPIKQIGNYSLGSEIGSGAFGKVILGHSLLTHDPVAIKILDKLILSQTPEDLSLVQKEISILKIVKHKYIVQLYEILEDAYSIYIIMEYCEGKDLMDNIITKGHLTEIESLKLFQQLINTLLYLHSQNITHRDIKIDNMLLDRNGDLKLVDFGLSTKYKDNELLNQPCGTVVYAAPEVLQGKEYHGMLCDVWSSGIVLFGMLSGYLPFSDSDDEVNKKNIIKGVIDYPKFISPFVKDLLKKMLEVNPMKRCTLKDILEHKWFNLIECRLIPGIIVGYNKIPIDDDAVLKCEEFGFDKNNIRKAVLNNLFNEYSAIYYLVIRRKIIEGKDSVSDLFSEKFVKFALDEDNIVLDLNKFKKKNIEDEKYDNDNLNKKHSGVIGAIRNLQNSKKNLTPLSNKNSSDFSETLDSNIRGISKEFTKNSTNQISLKSDKKDDFKIIVVKQKKFEDIRNFSNDNNENKNLNNNKNNNFSHEKKRNNKIMQSRNAKTNKKNNLIFTSSIDKKNNTFSKEVKKIINNKIQKYYFENSLNTKKNNTRNRYNILQLNNSISVKINKSIKNNSQDKKSIKNKVINSKNNSKNHKNNAAISTGKKIDTILKKNKKCSSSEKKNKRIIKPFSNTLNSNQKENKRKINILQTYEQNSLMMKKKDFQISNYTDSKTFNDFSGKKKLEFLNKSNLSNKNITMNLNSNIISPSSYKIKKKINISPINITNTNQKPKKTLNNSLINKETSLKLKYDSKYNKMRNKNEKIYNKSKSSRKENVTFETEYPQTSIKKSKINNCNSKTKRKNYGRNINNISSILYKKKSPLTYRDISDSPKQKILNSKTRLMKIPWKLKKDGINNNLDNKEIYSNYIKKFENKIRKKPKNLSNIRIKSSIESSFYKTENKTFITNIENTKKEIESTKLRMIQIRNNNKMNSLIHNNYSISISFDSNKNSKKNLINNIIPYYSGPIDFMCILNSNNIKDSIDFLIGKFKKNNINYIKLKLNKFKCSKNGNNYEIEIFQIDNGYINSDENIFYYKIKCKKDFYLSYRTLRQFLFE